MKKLLFPAVIIAGFFITGCNDDKTKTTSTDANVTADSPANNITPAPMDATATDAPFAMDAAEGGMAEVKLSELAQKQATGSSVKMLADMMVKDHSMANDELKAMAARMNISLPTAVNNMHQMKYDELAAKKGADFDKAYVDAMQTDHQATIDKFRAEADGGQNAEMKAWAAEKLPTLKHHLEMVNSTKSGLK